METERPLSIRLPEDLQRAAKAWCAVQGITMQEAFADRIARMIARKIGYKKGEAASTDPAPVATAGQSALSRPAEHSARLT